MMCVLDYVSDACLAEVTRSVGGDWRRLANQLRISVREERRHVTELDVLRSWRDRSSRPLDALRRALAAIHRTDLLHTVQLHQPPPSSGTDPHRPKLISTV